MDIQNKIFISLFRFYRGYWKNADGAAFQARGQMTMIVYVYILNLYFVLVKIGFVNHIGFLQSKLLLAAFAYYPIYLIIKNFTIGSECIEQVIDKLTHEELKSYRIISWIFEGTAFLLLLFLLLVLGGINDK